MNREEKDARIQSPSAQILDGHLHVDELKEFDHLDTRATIYSVYSNESCDKRVYEDLHSYDLLNIFGEYDSHGFPFSYEIQVG